MRTFIITLTAAVAAIAVGTTTAAHAAPDPRKGVVLVLGDSITQQYTDDPGDPQQGWWSMLAEKRELYPVTSAQGGGGLIKKGFGCSGTSVRERSASVIRRVQPDEIWIAVGRNDVNVCIKGKAVRMSPSFRERASKAYFAQLTDLAEELHIEPSNVYVTVPWGTNDPKPRHEVVVAYSTAARAAGLRFVNVPRLARTLTRDGTHPNNRGSRYIADKFGASMQPHQHPDPVTADTGPPAVTSVQ